MKLTKFCKKIAEISFYVFVFFLPWQTKFILRPAENNFSEISLYASHLLLLVVLIFFFFYKIRENDETEKISIFWYFLVGLEVFIIASFFFAPDKVLAFYHYVLFLVGIGLFYLVKEGTGAYGYQEGCLDKLKIFYSFLASIFLQVILGIYQFLSQSTPICKYLGLAGHDSQIAGASVIEAASGRWLRAYGGMDHPNIFGGVLAVVLVLVAYLLAKKKKINSGREIFISLFLFIFYFFGLFALFFTFSRSAWLALAVGLAVLFISLVINKDRWILGRYLAVLFFSIVLLAIVVPPYKDLVAVRVDVSTRLEKKSILERKTYLGQAEGLIKKNWLFGVGPGNYTQALETADKKISAWDKQPVHNVFLLVWAENGVFALLSLIGFLFFMIKKDRREIFSPAIFAALIVLMLFDHWLVSLPFGLLFFFLVLGLI